MDNILFSLGYACKRWRSEMDIPLKQIADETGYSISTISNFENGHNDNAIIFMWYLARGMNTETDFITYEKNHASIKDLWEAKDNGKSTNS